MIPLFVWWQVCYDSKYQPLASFSVPSDSSHSSATKLATASLLVVAMFVTGWLGGRHGTSAWAAIKQATIDSYQNRYRVMSDSGLDSIVYYVSTKDSLPLYAMACLLYTSDAADE